MCTARIRRGLSLRCSTAGLTFRASPAIEAILVEICFVFSRRRFHRGLRRSGAQVVRNHVDGDWGSELRQIAANPFDDVLGI